MPTLWACVNCFNDAKAIRRCLASVKRCAPHAKVVVVDGAYAAFPHPLGHPESTDGTLAVASEFADLVIRANGLAPWADECVKRSQYLVGKDGDQYLVIDADEELVGEVPQRLFVPDRDVMLESAAKPAMFMPYPIFRMFIHRGAPGAMHYEGAHMAVWAGDVLLNGQSREVAAGFRLLHWNHERDAARLIDKGTYYERMAKTEEPFRATHILV